MLISGYILLKFAVGMQKDAVSTTIHFGQDTSSSSSKFAKLQLFRRVVFQIKKWKIKGK